MRFPPYLPAPAAAPFTGAPRSFALDPEPRRRRTPDPRADFEAWCARREISSLPASGPVVASYLLDRSREIDDSGALAHTAGRLKSWIDVINAIHVEAGLPRVRSAPPVPAVLSSLIRYRGMLGVYGPVPASPRTLNVRGPQSSESAQRSGSLSSPAARASRVGSSGTLQALPVVPTATRLHRASSKIPPAYAAIANESLATCHVADESANDRAEPPRFRAATARSRRTPDRSRRGSGRRASAGRPARSPSVPALATRAAVLERSPHPAAQSLCTTVTPPWVRVSLLPRAARSPVHEQASELVRSLGSLAVCRDRLPPEVDPGDEPEDLPSGRHQTDVTGGRQQR